MYMSAWRWNIEEHRDDKCSEARQDCCPKRSLSGGEGDKQGACCHHQCHLLNAPSRHISVTESAVCLYIILTMITNITNVHLPRKRMAESVMTDAPCESVGSCSSRGWADSPISQAVGTFC